MKVTKTALIILFFIEIDVICGGKIQVSDCKEDKQDPCIGRCNNGTCIPLENGGYKCECPVGIGGYNCNKNPCLGACKNHIKCTPLAGNDFKCDCLPGFFGKTCEIDPCLGACKNHIKCTSLASDDFKCDCLPGFFGKTCEIDPCLGACKNHINCTSLASDDFKCDCLPGFSGKTCEIVLGTTCDFENNSTCDWSQDTQDEINWRFNSGRTSPFFTGPTADHTLGNASGIYIYMEATGEHAGSNARLISAVLTTNLDVQFFCLSFFYHMWTSRFQSMGSLNVFLKEHNDLTTIWSLTSNQGDEWLKADIPIILENSKEYQIILEAVRGEHEDSDIAIDDIILIDTATPCNHFPPEAEQPVLPPPLLEVGGIQGCQFENPQICHWTQVPKVSGWQYKAGETVTGLTGPSNDHTFNNASGHYLFVDGTVNSGINKLLSPIVTTSNTQCMEFYYHMRDIVGSSSLSVFQMTGNDTNGLTPVLTITGNQGNQWLKGKANFTGPPGYRVVFEATTCEPTSFCDIAIDDITAVACD